MTPKAKGAGKWEERARHGMLAAGAALGTPLYKEVKRLLVETISQGEWKPASTIPSERLLAERFQVAIGTVRKAVDELVAENVLVRQQGRGTFVAAHNRDRMLFHFFHIVRRDGTKETPTVRMLSFGRGSADAREARGLGIAPGAPVIRIRNALELGGVPVIHDAIVVPRALFPGLTAERFSGRPNTVYHLYQSAFGITVLRSRERLGIAPADSQVARVLSVEPGTPLLRIDRVALTFNDVPVEVRRSLVNTAEHEYFSDLAKSG